MRIIYSILSLFFILSCNNAKKNQNTDLEQAIIAFSELKAALEKESGKTWNYSLEGPLLIANRDTRIVIANEPDKNGNLTKKGDLFVGYFPDNLNIANTTVDWDGKRWTIVALPLPDNKEERLSLLIHESFHRIQSEIGFDNIPFKPCTHLDELQGRIYLKMEFEALKKALQANDKKAKSEHLVNALLFRQYRHTIFKDSKLNENFSEIKEGLAEYTGSILSGRNDQDLRKHYIDYIESLYNNPTFVSSFAYRTIPVYGYFMVKKDKYWNKQIKISTNLTDYMVVFFNVPTPTNLTETILDIQNQYYYDSISFFEKDRNHGKIELLKKYDSIFQINPTLTIPLQNMRIGFSPSNLTPYKNIGTVYPNCRITDNWGILTVDSSALVGKKWDKVTVSKPLEITNEVIKGNGWKLELNKDWELVKLEDNYALKKK